MYFGWLTEELLEELKLHLDGGSWPDQETYYLARRLYFRLNKAAEERKALAEKINEGLDSYGGNE